MTIVEGRVLAQAQRDFRIAFQTLFVGLLLEVRDLILQSGDDEGELNPVILPVLESRIAGKFSKFYMGTTGRPFSSDGLPQSIYANLLFRGYIYLVYDVFMAHHRWFLRNTPKAYRDNLARLPRRKAAYPTADQLEAAAREKYRVAEQSKPIPAHDTLYRQNPYMRFNPMNMLVPLHQDRLIWDGELKRVSVSRSIWGASQYSHRKVMDILREGIQSGLRVTEIAERLEQELSPAERRLFVRNPYINWEDFDGSIRRGAYSIPFPRLRDKRGGTMGKEDDTHAGRYYYNYSAMRLAQTELSRAFNHAHYTAALSNPAVIGLEWRLSPQHPRIDICDSIATLDKGGGRLRPPMSLENATIPPAHPWCLCYVEDALSSDDEFMRQLLDASAELGEMYEALQTQAQSDNNPYEGIDLVGNLLDNIFGTILTSTLPAGMPRLPRYNQYDLFEDEEDDIPF